MARRRKSDAEKALEFLKKEAEKQGAQLDLSAFGLTQEGGLNRELSSFARRELDAVSHYLRKPKSMLTKECNNCHEFFKTDWSNVSCCSVECYVAWFERTTGIKPNLAERPMWRYERPLVISAQTLKQIRSWATAILEDTQEVQEEPQYSPPSSSDDFDSSEPSDMSLEFAGIPSLELNDDPLANLPLMPDILE